MAESKPMSEEERSGIRERTAGYSPSVRDDVTRLLLENARLRHNLAGDIQVSELHYDGESFDTSFEGSAAKYLVVELINLYRTAAAENFLSLRMRDPETGEEFEVLIQRAEGVTPAQKAAAMRKGAVSVARLLEAGDNRLLAADGPVAGQTALAALEPDELAELYQACRAIEEAAK